MEKMINYADVEDRILTIRGHNVLIDRDVAELYGVETKRINEAVKNNPDKFLEGYITELIPEEWDSLRSKNPTLDKPMGRGQHTKYTPRAFSEKGLYMLATILKSPRATETTIAIVETFTKMRELSAIMSRLPVAQEAQQKALIRRSGEILAEVLDDNTLEVSGDETTIELNLMAVKIKHTIKREKKVK